MIKSCKMILGKKRGKKQQRIDGTKRKQIVTM